jgi:hypothetical protein
MLAVLYHRIVKNGTILIICGVRRKFKSAGSAALRRIFSSHLFPTANTVVISDFTHAVVPIDLGVKRLRTLNFFKN